MCLWRTPAHENDGPNSDSCVGVAVGLGIGIEMTSDTDSDTDPDVWLDLSSKQAAQFPNAVVPGRRAEAL